MKEIQQGNHNIAVAWVMAACKARQGKTAEAERFISITKNSEQVANLQQKASELNQQYKFSEAYYYDWQARHLNANLTRDLTYGNYFVYQWEELHEYYQSGRLSSDIYKTLHNLVDIALCLSPEASMGIIGFIGYCFKELKEILDYLDGIIEKKDLHQKDGTTSLAPQNI